MKAYAVVRKPEPTNKTISHTFKVHNKNPEISIDPIQENRSFTPQKVDSNQPQHLIQIKSRHFKVQESYKEPFRFSKSPPRKHPIFNQMISEFMESKMRKQSDQKLNSLNIQQNIQQSIYQKKFINFSKVSQQKSGSQSKFQMKQINTTPQKVKNKNQQRTPYEFLNRSERDSQRRPLSINRKNRIFQEYHNTSKQKRLGYLQQSQDKSYSFKRQLGYQLQILHCKSLHMAHEKPINQRQTTHQIFKAVGSTKFDKVREEDLSNSEVDIGCCGQQLNQKKDANYSQSNQWINRQDNSQSNKGNLGTNNVGRQYIAYSPQKSLQKSRRKIFNHMNPQLQRSNTRQVQSYKQDKIKSKPLPNKHKTKQLKVVVFEINSYSPFEF